MHFYGVIFYENLQHKLNIFVPYPLIGFVYSNVGFVLMKFVAELFVFAVCDEVFPCSHAIVTKVIIFGESNTRAKTNHAAPFTLVLNNIFRQVNSTISGLNRE